MLTRKALSKSAAILGGVAAIAMASPASATTIIDIQDFAELNIDNNSWSRSYGADSLFALRWGDGGSSASAFSFSAPSSSSIAPSSGSATSSVATGSTTLADGSARRFNSSVVLDAVRFRMDFDSRMTTLGTPALTTANLGRSIGVNAFSRAVAFSGPSVTSSSTPTVSAASATPITAVPEPATWLMLLLGFSFAGMMMRGSIRQDRVVYS